jgi:hypothetical protein
MITLMRGNQMTGETIGAVAGRLHASNVRCRQRYPDKKSVAMQKSTRSMLP